MEYVLSLALLVLNLIDYEHDLGKPVFTVVGAVLFVVLFWFVMRKTGNFLASCIVMMCYTWQISWINIFGDPTANLQLPWFYIIGALILGYAVFNVGKCMKRDYSVPLLIAFFAFLVLFNYPLYTSLSFERGLKEYIVIGFYAVVLLCTYIYKDTVPKDCYERIKSAFIWANFTTSFFLLFQYVMYFKFGIALYKINESMFFSGTQVSCHLLMEDHSCSTIMLGCGVFYVAERITKKKWFVYVPALLIILAAMAVTSRRTSTLTLIAVAVAYVLFHYRGLGKKFVFLVIFAAGAAVMLYYLVIVRPVQNASQILNDNGRFNNYAAAIDVIIKNPFGVGYDDAHLLYVMTDGVTPHNTLLRWMCMGGPLYALPLIVMIGAVIKTTAKKKMSAEFWAIIYSVVASNFIPDILNARFFIIPCAIAFLMNMKDGTQSIENEKAAVTV